MAVRMTILPTWDDHLEESFCYTVAHFERFNSRVKTSYYHPAENINETLVAVFMLCA